MKRTTLSIVVLTCLVVVLLIVTAFTAATSASAQLGNTGVPVRCSAGGNVSTANTLTCSAADGTVFGGGSTAVPTGRYLLVTDVQIEPTGPATGTWVISLSRMSSTGTEIDISAFTRHSPETYAMHYSSPIFVLSQGQYLRMINYWGNTSFTTVEVFGLLTTNYTYTPMIAR